MSEWQLLGAGVFVVSMSAYLGSGTLIMTVPWKIRPAWTPHAAVASYLGMIVGASVMLIAVAH